jgi:hypothetical protein
MTRRALDRLPLDEAVREIFSWPVTPTFKRLSDEHLEQTGRNLLNLWGEVAIDPDALGDLQIEMELEDGRPTPVGGRELAVIVVIHCLSFLNEVLNEISRRGRDLNLGDKWMSEPMRHWMERARNDPEDRLERLTTVYWAFLVSILSIPLLREVQRVEPYAAATFEMQSHWALGGLNQLRQSLVGSEREELLGEMALGTALRLAWSTYAGLNDQAHGMWKSTAGLHPGPFSTLRPRELAALASRSPVMARRYGEKRVEKVFETQLSLIIQSLGFVVVQTRSGERRVDLLCIAGGPGGGFTFLLEAKSTARAYGFPTSDERALADYVADVRRSLDTLPPLRFLLLVGPSPSRTLQSKIRRFESEHSIPTRFMTAGALANLREGLAGPIRAPMFETGLLASPWVVADETVTQFISAQRQAESAHAGLVRTLLSSSDWPREKPPRTKRGTGGPRASTKRGP